MELLDVLLAKDKLYQSSLKAANDLENRFLELPIDIKYRNLIEDYICCLESVHARKCKLAYIAGTLTDEEQFL